MLEADWAESSYGTVNVAGPKVGEKRKMGGEGKGKGRGKRVRVEESSGDDGEW